MKLKATGIVEVVEIEAGVLERLSVYIRTF